MPASRSLIALLVGTVVFFALWIIALKPSSSSNGGTKQGLGQYQSDINAARKAVKTENASNAASGNENAATSSGGATSQSSSTSTKTVTKTTTKAGSKTTTTRSTAKSSASTSHSAATNVAGELTMVRAAVAHHKVLALLFYNPAASDDRAVKQELAGVPTDKGKVVKLEIPVNDASSFTAVTQQVPVNLSPTLVVVSRSDDADELVGYVAPFVIQHEVDAALGSG